MGLGVSGYGATDQVKGISQQDFLRILSTQLTFQDPMKPMDNQQFMAQMAQFSALEQTRVANEKIDILLSQQAANQSLGLIGKTVEVTTDVGLGTVTGKVTTISFSSGEPQLTIQTSTKEVLTHISLTKVMLVRGE